MCRGCFLRIFVFGLPIALLYWQFMAKNYVHLQYQLLVCKTFLKKSVTYVIANEINSVETKIQWGLITFILTHSGWAFSGVLTDGA